MNSRMLIRKIVLRGLSMLLLTIFCVVLSGCSDILSEPIAEVHPEITAEQICIEDDQPFFRYNGNDYYLDPAAGRVYTALPDGYTYVGEAIDTGSIADLGEMECNVSGAIYKSDTSSDMAILAVSGKAFGESTLYLLCSLTKEVGKWDYPPAVFYNGVLYQTSPGGEFYTELPEGYTYVGATVCVWDKADLGEMESRDGGFLFRQESSSDTVIMAYSGSGYEDGLPRYVVYIKEEHINSGK